MFENDKDDLLSGRDQRANMKKKKSQAEISPPRRKSLFSNSLSIIEGASEIRYLVILAL